MVQGGGLSTGKGCCTINTRGRLDCATSFVVRGVMAIFVNAKNTQTTALRVRTGLTEHTCKGLGPVEAPTPRYTHDCARIFPFLAMLATSSAPVHQDASQQPWRASRCTAGVCGAAGCTGTSSAGRGATHRTSLLNLSLSGESHFSHFSTAPQVTPQAAHWGSDGRMHAHGRGPGCRLMHRRDGQQGDRLTMAKRGWDLGNVAPQANFRPVSSVPGWDTPWNSKVTRYASKTCQTLSTEARISLVVPELWGGANSFSAQASRRRSPKLPRFLSAALAWILLDAL